MLRETENEMLVKYLLGQLSEQELESIEDHYFKDIEFFEQLLVVEDELIDAYVRRELSREESQRFEDYFLQSPERRDKVEFAEAWQVFITRQAQSHEPYTPPQPQTVFKQRHFLLPLAASLIMAVGVTWLLIDQIGLKNKLDRLQSDLARMEERQRSPEEKLNEQKSSEETSRKPVEEQASRAAAPSKQVSRPRSPATVVSFTLSSFLTRESGKSKPLIIPSGTKQVRLRASFNHYDYTHFSARLKTSRDVEIRRWTDLKPTIQGSTGTIVLKLDADSLSNDDYILTVSGATKTGDEEVIDDFAFTVEKE